MRKIAAVNALILVFMLSAWLSAGCQGSGHESSSQLQKGAEQSAGDVQNQGASGPAPKIEFAETSYDFGTVTQQSSVSHTFKVKNTGDAPLELIRAKGP